MADCVECGKKLGFFEGYRHPTMGGNNLVCRACIYNVYKSVEKWREFVISNSFNNVASNNHLKLRMKKIPTRFTHKQKIFGIGVAVLLVMLTISPLLTVSKNAYLGFDINQQIEQFLEEHQEELNIFNQYIKNLKEIPSEDEIPENIICIIGTLSEELTQIIGNAYYRRYFQWNGINSVWGSDTMEQFFDFSELYFWGVVVSLNETLTDLLMTIVGLDVATVLLFLVANFPIIGPWLVVIFGMILYKYWDYFLEFIELIYETCPYGCMLWFFWSPGSHFQGELVPPLPWLQPNNSWIPEDWFPQANWTRLL